MAFNLFRRKSSGRRTGNRLSRHEPVSDKPDSNKVRGHALFVRFLERRGLSDCVRYFPEDMTLGLLRDLSPRELLLVYHVENARDRERIMRVIEESCRDEHSEEVCLICYFDLVTLIFDLWPITLLENTPPVIPFFKRLRKEQQFSTLNGWTWNKK